MHILVDFLTFSDKSHDIDFWIEKLYLENVQFMAFRPANGWEEHLSFHGLHLHYGKRDDVCIDMSGTGCRFFESNYQECTGREFDWICFFDELLNMSGVHFSRLDIAGDDRDSILDISKIMNAVKKRKYISRARRKIIIDGDEREVMFGSKASDTRLRIYDKALERGVDEHWIRCEFQFRNDAALSFLLNLTQKRDIGVTFAGVLLNYIRFTVSAPDENNNNSRIKTTKWWSKFLQTSERKKNIKVGGLEYNYESLKDFLVKQCASSCKTFLELNDGDIDSLLDIINASEFNARQRVLLSEIRKTD